MALSGHWGAAVSQQAGGLPLGAGGTVPSERTERTAVTLGRGQLGAASDCQALSLGWKFCHQKTPGLGRPSPSFPPHPVHPLGQNRSPSFSEDFFPASSCTTPLGLVLEADDDLLNPDI